jgi:hypothetical protein
VFYKLKPASSAEGTSRFRAFSYGNSSFIPRYKNGRNGVNFLFNLRVKWCVDSFIFFVYISTRVGLVLTGSSVFALLSFGLQDALLGTNFNWTAPSVFSGVSFFFHSFLRTLRPLSYLSFFSLS